MLPIAIDPTSVVKARLALRGAPELLVAQIELVSVEILAIAQHAPWQCAIILADAEKPAEAHHGVSDLAAALVDHHAFDRADVVAVATPYRRALDLVAGDQARGFPHHNFRSDSRHRILLAMSSAGKQPGAGPCCSVRRFRPGQGVRARRPGARPGLGR